MSIILDQRAPGLSEQLRALSSQQRRRVVAKACQAVSRSVDELEPRLAELIRFATERNALSAEQVEELRQYSENADKRYFTLQEEGVEKRIWGNWFSKARLGTALANAFGSEDWEAAADAVYETLFVEDTEDRAIRLVRSEIDLLSND